MNSTWIIVKYSYLEPEISSGCENSAACYVGQLKKTGYFIFYLRPFLINQLFMEVKETNGEFKGIIH